MPSFDLKNFNGEVFGKYVQTVPKTTTNELLKSGVLNRRSDLKEMFKDQTGGNYQSTPIYGRIGGVADNYDGVTDLTADKLDTFMQSMIVVGRAHGWTEKDFSYEMTGKDFMSQVGDQVSDYFEDIDQDTLLAILKGIFAMSGAGNNDFVTNHTYDITELSGDAAKAGATTLNSALQKASGDKKANFALAIMHSAVATNLENLQLLSYLKYTDANGIQRDLAMGTWNGKIVIIDDGVPTEVNGGTAEVLGIYNAKISTNVVADDVINIEGKELTAVSADPVVGTSFVPGGTITETVANIVAALAGSMPFGYNVTASTTNLVLTQTTGNGTSNSPSVSITGTGVVDDIVVKTEGKAATVGSTEYTTYAFGRGAIDYEDMGVKVPYEMERDAKTNGGLTTLYGRQRKLFAPKGISFTNVSMAGLSPTNTELENGANWALVKNTDGSKFYSHKNIYIARIKSLG